MYAAYNKLYYNALESKISIKTDFEKLTNTKYWEQYMTNAFQFSAAKNATEMRMLQENVFNKDKERRGFSEFKNLPEVQNIMDKFNGPDWWLRTEYDLASRGAVMAEKWQRDTKDRDLNPYWIYVCMDSPCDICEPLDGKIFKYDEGDDCFPPNHFNCECTTEPTDDAGENEENLISSDELESLQDNIPEQFQGNVGSDGIFPREGSSYYDTLPSANDAGVELFGAKKTGSTKLSTQARTQNQALVIFREWQATELKAPENQNDIIFRNHEWMLNVRMTQESLNKIGKKTRGIENIKKTIEHPDEIYAKWVDPKKQKAVHMTYMVHDGKFTYFVETESGKVTDAYFRQHVDSKALRKIGVKLMK